MLVVVSGDSDLEPAIQWIRQNYQKTKVSVYIPAIKEEKRHRRNDYYPTIGVQCKFLPLGSMEKHQLRSKIILANGKIVERPKLWESARAPIRGKSAIQAGLTVFRGSRGTGDQID